jgi:hypothetical protein
MKSTLLIMAGLLAGMASYAQTSNNSAGDDGDLKPKAKKISTELNVNPFNGQLNLNNSLNQIKLRYFAKPDFAVRLGFNVNKRDSIYNINNAYGTTSNFFNDDRKSTTFGLNAGIEKHFTGTRRLSPYIGVDVTYSQRSASEKIENNGATINVKNGWYSTTVVGNTIVGQPQQTAFSRYGVNLVSGFDFYMARHFFFGYEFNLGISKTSWKTVQVTQTGQGSTSVPTSSTGKNSTVNFGTSLQNGIRIGYTF